MQADVILGLSGIRARFAVALVRDGEVVFAVEEDKLGRFRGLGFSHFGGVGSRALDLALQKVAGGISGVSRVAYVPPIDTPREAVTGDTAEIAAFLARQYGVSMTAQAVDHVEAHLAFERAVHPHVDPVFMLGRSRAVFSSGPGDTYVLDTATDLVPGIERLAAFAGFPPTRIHHLENMARFGEPRFAHGIEELLARPGAAKVPDSRIAEVCGFDRRRGGEPIGQNHYDFAASVYSVLEARVIDLLRAVPEAQRSGAVSVCGGVFQSWSLNDAVAAALPDSRVLTSFAPGNASGAIGGALALGRVRPSRPTGPFLGPAYSREEIKSVLDNSKVRYALHSSKETLRRVCEALEAGQMVGWFEGRCEFGYRALGSRSVFANPANPYACDNLSSYLKKRPSYFAYAVALKAEDPILSGIESPFLSRSAVVSDYFGDARVRVQSVTKADAPALWQLLDQFTARTGVTSLLNTSLNYFDEPIACTPRDALKTFYASGLDMLVMEDFLLTKQ